MKTSTNTRGQARHRGNGIKAAMAAGGRRARHVIDEAEDVVHRGSAAAVRVERQFLTRAGRVAKDAAAAIRHRPKSAAAAALAGAGLLYLLAKMRRGL